MIPDYDTSRHRNGSTTNTTNKDDIKGDDSDDDIDNDNEKNEKKKKNEWDEWINEKKRAERLLSEGMSSRITLQMRGGKVPLRIVERGTERFFDPPSSY